MFEGKDISICIITKNECDRLERCLKQAKGLGFELVVVDTGSTDNTCEMVKGYTDRLFHFGWINDFAAAKNYAASMASNDMVMILDSDEYVEELSEADIAAVLDGVSQHSLDVGRLHRINDVYQGQELTKYHDYTNRIFDRRSFCFEGKIHE